MKNDLIQRKIEQYEAELKEVNSALAKQRHVLSDAKKKLKVVESIHTEWEQRAPAGSHWQTANNEVAAAKIDYSKLARKKKNVIKSINTLKS